MMTERIGLFGTDGSAIAFRGAAVSARLAGLLAETRLDQHYLNDTGETLEIAYTFALPVDAVLLGFEVALGERRLAGQVVARSDAEARYEQAVEAGDSAFRLTMLADGLYSAALGNVLPGESVTIHLSYAEPLTLAAGCLRYRLPTTLAPRYGEPEGFEPWQRPQTSLMVEYAFEAQVHLCGALAGARVGSPSHRISSKASEGETCITVKAATMDRDFILEIQPVAEQSLGVCAPLAEDGAIAAVSFLPPAREDHRSGRDIVIVLDCSGSMAGDSMRLATAGVIEALGCLNREDAFGVVVFGNRARCFEQKLTRASAGKVSAAIEFVRNAGDMGGTELAGALRAAMALIPEGREADILLLTDGEVWSLDRITREVSARGIRLFTVGIGSAVAEDMVRNLADETGGACELVAPNEDMPGRIAAHLARMRQPRIVDFSLDWGVRPDWEVRPVRAVFAGDAFTLHAALPEAASVASARLQYSEGSVETFDVPLAPLPRLADTLLRVAAAARLPRMAAKARAAWALQHQLVTDETDYIVVLERAADERTAGVPRLQVTPQMMAAGHAGMGSVILASPRRALDEVPAVMRSAPLAACLESRSESIRECAFEFDDSAVFSKAPATLHREAATTPEAFLQQIEAMCAGAGIMGLPASLAELRELGVPPELVKNLERLVEEGASESDVIKLFVELLAVLAQPDATTSAAKSCARLLAPFSPAADGRALGAKMVKLLAGTRACQWPAVCATGEGLGNHEIPAFLRTASK